LAFLALITDVSYARFSTFNELDTIRKIQQGVEVFAQKDIDRDGDVDWVVQNRTTGEIAIIFNKRYGMTSTILRTPSVRTVNELDFGYADGDSIADVLVCGVRGEYANVVYPSNLSVIYGVGMLYQDSVDIHIDAEVMSARFMDINGDGRDDIIAAVGKSKSVICWFENTGVGVWEKHSIDETIADLGLNSWIKTADIDNDGKIDFVHGNASSNSIIWYRNNGDGTFTKKVIASETPVGCGTIVDIDLDGDVDIINGKLIFYHDKGVFVKDTISDPPEYEANFTDAGDVNGDGYPDIVATVWDGGMYLWQSVPGKKFTRTSLGYSSDAKAILIGDADHDRFNDIVFVSQTSGTFRYLRNSGIFAFESTKLIPNLQLLTGFDTADVDKDGDIDLFVTERNTFYVFENRRDSLVKVYSGHCESYATVQTGDFNGDGKVDFILNKGNPAVWYKQSTFPLFTQQYIPKKLDPIQCIDLHRDGGVDITGGFLNTQSKHYIIAYSRTDTSQFKEDTLYEGSFKSYHFSDLDNDDTMEYSFADAEYDPSNRYVNYDINSDKKLELLYFVADSGNFGIKYNCIDTNRDGKSDLIKRNLMKVARREGDITGGDLDKDTLDDVIIANDKNLYWISQTTRFGFNSTNMINKGTCTGNIIAVDFDKDGWTDVLSCDSHAVMLHRNLLGVPPAKVDIPVRVSSSIKRVDLHPVTPVPIGNTCFSWNLSTDIKKPKIQFFLVTGAKVSIPVYIQQNRCIADFRSYCHKLSRVLVWVLYDERGKRLGNGLLTTVK
jgi:hypothetical protein